MTGIGSNNPPNAEERLKFVLSNFCDMHKQVVTLSSGPCLMCENERASLTSATAGETPITCQCGDGGCIQCWPSNFTKEALVKFVSSLRARAEPPSTAPEDTRATTSEPWGKGIQFPAKPEEK